MKKMSKPKDLSKAEEKYWKEAEEIVEEQYSKTKEPDRYYGTLSEIFKSKVEKYLKHDPFEAARKRKEKREKKSSLGRAQRFLKSAQSQQDVDSIKGFVSEFSDYVSLAPSMLEKLQRTMLNERDFVKKQELQNQYDVLRQLMSK